MEENSYPFQTCPWHMFWLPQCFLSQRDVSVLESPQVHLADGGSLPWMQFLSPSSFTQRFWMRGPWELSTEGKVTDTAWHSVYRPGREGREKCEEADWEKARSHLCWTPWGESYFLICQEWKSSLSVALTSALLHNYLDHLETSSLSSKGCHRHLNVIINKF